MNIKLNRKKKIYILVTILIIFIAIIYKKNFIDKYTYKTVAVKVGNMNSNVYGIGNISAKNTYKVGSIFSGEIEGFTLQEGDLVKKGDVVATIDSVDLIFKIKESQANILASNSDLNALIIDKKRALDEFNYKELLFKKFETLYAKKAVSEVAYVKYSNDLDIAKSKVDKLVAQINSTKGHIDQLIATKEGLQAKLGKYTIVSNTDGVVINKLVDNHNIISKGQVLVEIVNPNDIWIDSYVDTRVSGGVEIGDKVTIGLDSTNKIYNGHVVNINPYNNKITNERNIRVRFDTLPKPYYLEEQAYVNINIGSFYNIAMIPVNSVIKHAGKSSVWIISNNKASLKQINILARNNKFIATNDLSINDRVITSTENKAKLVSGMSVYYD